MDIGIPFNHSINELASFEARKGPLWRGELSSCLVCVQATAPHEALVKVQRKYTICIIYTLGVKDYQKNGL